MYPSCPHGWGKLALTRRQTRTTPRRYAVCLAREQRPELLAVRSFSGLRYLLPHIYGTLLVFRAVSTIIPTLNPQLFTGECSN